MLTDEERKKNKFTNLNEFIHFGIVRKRTKRKSYTLDLVERDDTDVCSWKHKLAAKW